MNDLAAVLGGQGGDLVYQEPHAGRDISYLLDKAGHGRAPRPGEYVDRKIPPSVIPPEHHIKKVYPTPPTNAPGSSNACEFNAETRMWEVTLFPSSNPSGRGNVVMLSRWLHERMDALEHEVESILPQLYQAQRTYAMALHEIMRQTTWDHAERGALLKKLCKFHFVMFQRLLSLAKKQNQFDRGEHITKLKAKKKATMRKYEADVTKLLAAYKEEEDEAEAKNETWQTSIDAVQKEIEGSVEEMHWYEGQEDSMREETALLRNLLGRLEEKSAALQEEFGSLHDGFLKHLDMYWARLSERVTTLRKCEYAFRRKLGDRVASKWTGYSLEMQRQFDVYGMNDYIADPDNVLEPEDEEEPIEDVPAWEDVMQEIDNLVAESVSTESEEIIEEADGTKTKRLRRKRKVKLRRAKTSNTVPKRLPKRKGKVTLSRVAKYKISETKISDRLLKWKKKRKAKPKPTAKPRRRRVRKVRTLPSGREQSYTTDDEEDTRNEFEYSHAFRSGGGVAPKRHETMAGVQTEAPSFTDQWLNPHGTRETGYSHVISLTWNEAQRARAKDKLKRVASHVVRGSKTLKGWKGTASAKPAESRPERRQDSRHRQAQSVARSILKGILNSMFDGKPSPPTGKKGKGRRSRRASLNPLASRQTAASQARNSDRLSSDSASSKPGQRRRRSIAVTSHEYVDLASSTSESTVRRKKSGTWRQLSASGAAQLDGSSGANVARRTSSKSRVSDPAAASQAAADLEKSLANRLSQIIGVEVAELKGALNSSDLGGSSRHGSRHGSRANSPTRRGSRSTAVSRTNSNISLAKDGFSPSPSSRRKSSSSGQPGPQRRRSLAHSDLGIGSNSLMVSGDGRGSGDAESVRSGSLGPDYAPSPSTKRAGTSKSNASGKSPRNRRRSSTLSVRSNKSTRNRSKSVTTRRRRTASDGVKSDFTRGGDVGARLGIQDTITEGENESNWDSGSEISDDNTSVLSYQFPYAVFADTVRLRHEVPFAELPDGSYEIIKSRTLIWTRRHINQIYEVKVATDSGESKSKLKKKNQPFSDFIYDFYLFKYGLRDLTELNLVDLMDHAVAYQDTDVKCRWFSRFVGLEPEHALPLAAVNFYLNAVNLLKMEAGDRYHLNEETDKVTVSLSGTLRTVQRLFAGLPQTDMARVEKSVCDLPREEVMEGTAIVTSVDGDDFLEICLDTWEHYEKINVSILKVFFRAGDYDQSGELSYDEFGAIMREIDNSFTEREIGLLFEKALGILPGQEIVDEEETITWESLIKVLRNAGLVSYRPNDALLLEDSQSQDFFTDLRQTWAQRVPLIFDQFEELRSYEGHDTVDRLSRRMDFVAELLATGFNHSDRYAGAVAYHAVKITINMCNYTLEMYRRGVLDRDSFLGHAEAMAPVPSSRGFKYDRESDPASTSPQASNRRRRSISHNLGGMHALSRTDSSSAILVGERGRPSSANEGSLVSFVGSKASTAMGLPVPQFDVDLAVANDDPHLSRSVPVVLTNDATEPGRNPGSLSVTVDNSSSEGRDAGGQLTTHNLQSLHDKDGLGGSQRLPAPTNPWEVASVASTAVTALDPQAPGYRRERRKSVINMLPEPAVLSGRSPKPPRHLRIDVDSDPQPFAGKGVQEVEDTIPSPRRAPYVPPLDFIREEKSEEDLDIVRERRTTRDSASSRLSNRSAADLQTVNINGPPGSSELADSGTGDSAEAFVLPYRRERSKPAPPEASGKMSASLVNTIAPVPNASPIVGGSTVPRKETLKESQSGSGRQRTTSMPLRRETIELAHARALGFTPKLDPAHTPKTPTSSMLHPTSTGKIDSSGLDAVEQNRTMQQIQRRRRSTIGFMMDSMAQGSAASSSLSSQLDSLPSGRNRASSRNLSLTKQTLEFADGSSRQRGSSISARRPSMQPRAGDKNVTVVDLSQGIDFNAGTGRATSLAPPGALAPEGADTPVPTGNTRGGLATGLAQTAAANKDKKMGSVVSAMMTVMRWKKKIQKTLAARKAGAAAKAAAGSESVQPASPGQRPWAVQKPAENLRRETNASRIQEDEAPKKIRGLTKDAAEIRLGLKQPERVETPPTPGARSRAHSKLNSELDRALGKTREPERDAPINDMDRLALYDDAEGVRPQASSVNLPVLAGPVPEPHPPPSNTLAPGGRRPAPTPRKIVYANVKTPNPPRHGDSADLANNRSTSQGSYGSLPGASEPAPAPAPVQRTDSGVTKYKFLHKPGFTPSQVRTRAASDEKSAK